MEGPASVWLGAHGESIVACLSAADSVMPMTPATRQRRRLPAEIYWRRRLLILAAVLLVAWVIVQFVNEPGDSKKTSSAPTTPTVRVIPTEAGPPNGKISVELAAATGACDPEKVRVTPSVQNGQFVDGVVKVSLIVNSTQKNACTLNAKTADLLVVISANDSAIWDSSVCKESFLAEPVTISSQWATVAKTTWSGRGSVPNCSNEEAFGSPGKYVIKAATLGGEPGSDGFNLVRRPTEKPEESPATEPGKKSVDPKN